MQDTFEIALQKMKKAFLSNGPSKPNKYKFIVRGGMFEFAGEKIPYISYGGNRQIMSESQYRKAMAEYRKEEVKFKYNFLRTNYPDTDYAKRYIEEIAKKDRYTSKLDFEKILNPVSERSEICA